MSSELHYQGLSSWAQKMLRMFRLHKHMSNLNLHVDNITQNFKNYWAGEVCFPGGPMVL